MSEGKGKVPEGWEIKTLESVSKKITSGATPLRSEGSRYFSTNGHNWVKTTDLNNSYIYNTEEQITDEAIRETACKIVPVGTVLIAMYGGFNQIGRTGILAKESAVNQALSALQLKENVMPEFVNSWLIFKRGMWKDFAASSRKDPNITRNDVCSFPILLPPCPNNGASPPFSPPGTTR